MMVKSGPDIFILKFLHAGRRLILLLNLQFWAKIFPFMKEMISQMEEFQSKIF